MIPADFAVEQGAVRRPVQHNVPVGPAFGAETRMKIINGFFQPEQGDVVRQPGIGASQPLVIRTLYLNIEVHDLASGVYAGVGSAGSNDAYGVVRDRRQCGLQAVLNGPLAKLGLPAAKAGSVVLNSRRDTHDAAVASDARTATRRRPVVARLTDDVA